MQIVRIERQVSILVIGTVSFQLMRMSFAGSKEGGNQDQGFSDGELKGKYTPVNAHWVWCQFGVVNGRPDRE